MPNWVRNIVWFSGDKGKIAELKALVKSNSNEFDFNKIIPMPQELDMESGGKETVAIACAEARMRGKSTCSELSKYAWLEKEMPFDMWADLGDRYLKNKRQHGFTTWYDWCCHYWGTKWNASEVNWRTERCVCFDTAWSAPLPIFAKLADMFPGVKITVDYADEDIGNNCDTCEFYVSSDDFSGFRYPRIAGFVEGSETAQRFACEIWDLDFEEWIEEWRSWEEEGEPEEPDTTAVLELLE